MKKLLGYFNEKLGREDIFTQTIGSDTQDINDNGVRIVNFTTSKNIVKSMMFPH
jgi:hypothetical protein